MFTEKIFSRITIDISKETHKRLKAMAALYGKTMREVIIAAIDKHIQYKKRTKKIASEHETEQLDKAIGDALEKYSTAYQKIIMTGKQTTKQNSRRNEGPLL